MKLKQDLIRRGVSWAERPIIYSPEFLFDYSSGEHTQSGVGKIPKITTREICQGVRMIQGTVLRWSLCVELTAKLQVREKRNVKRSNFVFLI